MDSSFIYSFIFYCYSDMRKRNISTVVPVQTEPVTNAEKKNKKNDDKNNDDDNDNNEVYARDLCDFNDVII